MRTHIRLRKIIASSFILLFAYSSVLYAQNDTLYMQKNEEGKIKFARFSMNGKKESKQYLSCRA